MNSNDSSLWKDAKKLVEHPLNSQKEFQGNLLHVFRDTARLPGGQTSTREWIKHPGACTIIPVFEDATIMMVKQFRYPNRQIFYEVPAGKIDPGESEELTAIRELEEETGLQAESLEYIGHFYPCIGYSDEIIHVYTAWNLRQTGKQQDEDEFLENYRLPFREALRMIGSGEISDAKSLCSLVKTRMWWEASGPFEIDF